MTAMGPNEQELRKVLHASSIALGNASTDWESGRRALDKVTAELDKGIEGLGEEMGTNTREAALASFRAMRTRVEEHKTSLALGRDALDVASGAIEKATTVAQTGLPGVNGAPSKKDSGDSAADAVDYARQVRAYDLSVSAREHTAGEALRHLNTSLDISIAKMRESRGLPPEDPTTPGTGSSGGSGSSSAGNYPTHGVRNYVPPGTSGSDGSSSDPIGGGTQGPGDPSYPGPGDPGHPGPGDPGWPGPTVPGGPSWPGGPVGPGGPGGPFGPGGQPDGGSVFGIPGGLTGSLSGALVGGGSLAGSLRGLSGLRGSATRLSEAATSSTSGVGSRAAGGMMGRSAGTGSGSAGRAGSRGGRGAGAGMGGRNGQKSRGKGKGKVIDHLVEEDAWLDDEGTGPDVLA